MDVRQAFAKLLREIEIHESDSKKVKREKRERLHSFLKEHMPTPLYRYRKLKYDKEAFINGYISTSKPCTFEEFDSQIEIDKREVLTTVHNGFPPFEDLYTWICSGKKIPSSPLKNFPWRVQIVVKLGLWVMKNGAHFKENLRCAHRDVKKDINRQINTMRDNEIDDELRYRRYIACFCEKIDVYDMWKGYANFDGFALEYDFTLNIPDEHVLFPVIYGEKYNATRLAITSMINLLPSILLRRFPIQPFWNIFFNWPNFFKKEKLLRFFDELFYLKGYAYKKDEFKKEQEWRLLSPETHKSSDKRSFVPYNPVAIYFCDTMEKVAFDELNQIAKDKGLKRYRAILDESKKTVTIEPLS